MPKQIFVFLLLALLAFFARAAATELAPQTGIDQFFKDDEIGTASLSPNGRYLATTARKNGTLQLAVVDLEAQQAKVLAGYRDLDIASISWLENERLVYHVVDRSSPANSTQTGLYTVGRESGKVSVLLPTPRDMVIRSHYDITEKPLGMRLVAGAPDDSGAAITLGYFRDGDVRPYRVRLASGKRDDIDFDLPGLPRNFWFDAKGQLRAAATVTARDGKTIVLWYRDSVAAPWQKLSEHPSRDPAFDIVGLVGGTLYVSAPAGKRAGIYEYDMNSKKLGKLVASDPDASVESALVVAPGADRVIGVRIPSEPPRTLWLERRWEALQTSIDAAHPGKVNVIFPGTENAASMVFSYSATDPGRFLRFNPALKKLEPLVRRMPWIDPAHMAEQLVFDYQARDGLPIMAYLTLPKGRPAKSLPLIMLVHGGPWARDQWGFSSEVQFLASRGYAVLQPQFRGSTGFGSAHLEMGFQQWGRAMQDDLTDGVQTLIRQGVADPARVCIMGASYGGYAAMMGLVREPGMFKCGVNLLGVTDLDELVTKGRWYGPGYDYSVKTMIADPATMREQIVATSPMKQAARIQAPVFMAYGEKDWRVPLEHGTGMRNALKDAGKTFEWMSFVDEEHGFAHQENRIKVYTAIDAFLKKYNPAN